MNSSVLLNDKFEETKGIIRSRKWRNRQYNDNKRTKDKQLSTNYYTENKRLRNMYPTYKILCPLLCSDFYSRFLNFLGILFCHCDLHLQNLENKHMLKTRHWSHRKYMILTVYIGNSLNHQTVYVFLSII